MEIECPDCESRLYVPFKDVEHFKKLEKIYHMLYEIKDREPRAEKIIKVVDDAESDLDFDTEKMNELTRELNEELHPIDWNR